MSTYYSLISPRKDWNFNPTSNKTIPSVSEFVNPYTSVGTPELFEFDEHRASGKHIDQLPKWIFLPNETLWRKYGGYDGAGLQNKSDMESDNLIAAKLIIEAGRIFVEPFAEVIALNNSSTILSMDDSINSDMDISLSGTISGETFSGEESGTISGEESGTISGETNSGEETISGEETNSGEETISGEEYGTFSGQTISEEESGTISEKESPTDSKLTGTLQKPKTLPMSIQNVYA